MSHQEDTTKERKATPHINRCERDTIERFYKEGLSIGQIALLLKRDKSTIKREIKRGTVTQVKQNPSYSKKVDWSERISYTIYLAEVGQKRYEENRKRCGAKNKVIQCTDMVEFVESKIRSREKWSVDAAVGYAKENRLFRHTFTTKTFYNWIEDRIVRTRNIDLPLKVRRKPKSLRRERKKVLGRSIYERPKHIQERKEFGHWEGDGIVGKEQRGHILTLVERKIGIGMMFCVGDKESSRIVEVLDRLERDYGDSFSKIFKSITFDNGSEFASSEEMERNGRTEIYYAHPYSSFERGTNENWNGIVRRFIPKGSSFEQLTERDMVRISGYINTLPRKRHRYKTPQELWEAELDAIMVTETRRGKVSEQPVPLL